MQKPTDMPEKIRADGINEFLYYLSIGYTQELAFAKSVKVNNPTSHEALPALIQQPKVIFIYRGE